MNDKRSQNVCQGLLSVHRSKISMEHNVTRRAYVIYKEDQSTLNAIEDASIQQSLLALKLHLSKEKVKSFKILTKQRARSSQPSPLSGIGKGSCISNTQKVLKRTSFEMAFEKVQVVCLNFNRNNLIQVTMITSSGANQNEKTLINQGII